MARKKNNLKKILIYIALLIFVGALFGPGLKIIRNGMRNTVTVETQNSEDQSKAVTKVEDTVEQDFSKLDSSIYHAPKSIYKNGLNFIFFSDGYRQWEEFDNDVAMFAREMKQVEPWKSYDRYNIYEILPDESGICAIKSENERKTTLRCDPDGVNRYLNKLYVENFKFVVLSRKEFQSWTNQVRFADSGIFMSIPKSPSETDGRDKILGLGFQHLLAHSFGVKDEEILVLAKADSAGYKADGPNCAPDKQTAKKWWGDLVEGNPRVGYFTGCSGHKEYIKPTVGSIMNLSDLSTFVPDYGPVSERYLKKILTYCFSPEKHSIEEDPEFFAQYPEFKECVMR